MIHGFDPQTALERARAGEVPSGWRVLKADLSYGKALQALYFDVPVVLLEYVLFLGIAVALSFVLRMVFHLSDGVFFYVLFLALTNRLEPALMYFFRAKHSLLLFTPDGFLQCQDIRKPTFQGRAYAYAEMASIKIASRSSSETTLQFTPYRGKATTWTCPYWYGPAKPTAQAIIDAHARYQALNDHPNVLGEKEE